MKKLNAVPPKSSEDYNLSPYKAIADRARVSERTVRYALGGKAITIQTALKLSRMMGIPLMSFRIKDDRRGLTKTIRRKKE